MSEEETAPEPKVEEKKPECYVVPDHLKPLIDCCEKYEKGEIGDGDFFANALIRTGEFMKGVRERREKPSE